MARLRYNNALGTLGASLASASPGATGTITFAAAPAFATIAAPDYIPLVLDPPTSSPNASFEVVYLTAYTAGATTGTILRGQEGSSAGAHASGASWVCGPTALDVNLAVAPPPAPPARAYRNAAFASTGGSFAKVPLDTLSFGPDGSMDAVTNHRYNAPVAGYYRVEAEIYSSGAPCYLAVYKNGTLASQAGQASTSGGLPSLSDVIYCNAGDYLELWASTGAALTVGSAASNYLAVTPLVNAAAAAQVPPSRAYRSAALSLTGAQKIPLDTRSFDPTGNMDVTTNGRYNVPVAGTYLVTGEVCFGNSQSETQARIYQNGSLISVGGDAGAYGATVADVLTCAAGDYIELWAYCSGSSQALNNVSQRNYLSVVPLGGANYATPTQPSYQNGVMNAADALPSAISLSTSTGALTFTLAAANPIWVKNASGLVVPASLLAQGVTLTPGALPASGNYAVYGVEVDVNGALYLVKGTDTATQLNTGSLIAANSPAVTSGRVRIADFSLRNSSGTINFGDATTAASQGVNWIDRRPWARGAYAQAAIASGNPTASGSPVLLSALSMRVECSGVPLRLFCTGNLYNTTQGTGTGFDAYVDGAVLYSAQNGGVQKANGGYQTELDERYIPSAGSHLFQFYLSAAPGGNTQGAAPSAQYPLAAAVEEIMRVNASNGTA